MIRTILSRKKDIYVLLLLCIISSLSLTYERIEECCLVCRVEYQRYRYCRRASEDVQDETEEQGYKECVLSKLHVLPETSISAVEEVSLYQAVCVDCFLSFAGLDWFGISSRGCQRLCANLR